MDRGGPHVRGGVIHLAVLRHHLDHPAITTGFTMVGGAQWLLAARTLANPTPRTRLAVLLLHVAIASMWLLTRSVGLVIVPGAHDRTPVGIADVVANVLKVAVGVLVMMVPAVPATHDHAGHDHPATEGPVSEHDHGPSDSGHDDHDHDHG